MIGAGEVLWTKVARQTGLPVTVKRADTDDDPEGRWETVCDEHGFVCSHATRRLAVLFSASPKDWCEVCSGEYVPETDDAGLCAGSRTKAIARPRPGTRYADPACKVCGRVFPSVAFPYAYEALPAHEPEEISLERVECLGAPIRTAS